MNSTCWRFWGFGGLLLGFSHPLNDKARSPPDQDVLLLRRSVHNRGHQQLPERLPRLDQEVVGPATEALVSQENEDLALFAELAACYCLLITLMESNYFSFETRIELAKDRVSCTTTLK